MAHLALALLGPFQATLDDQPVQGLNSDHLCALLAYLAVERGREHTREALASLLWPERPDREAVSALRHALANLRSALGDRGAPYPVLLVTRSSVRLNPSGDYRLDVVEFERRAGQDLTGVDRREDLSGLTAAIELYRGPFLHGLSLAESPTFEEWMLFKGEEYRRRVLSLLERLTSLHLAHGQTAEAERWARRQLELEPYHEEAHRQLMAALALAGERPAALAQYEACRRLLAQELGCEPDDETQALCAQIRAGALPFPASPPHPVSAPPPGPVSASRFVARGRELARLGSLLEGAIAGRGGVALISGEAGSGKTALLGELARRACLAHGDLIALRGSCSAHHGSGDPYLPFRELLRALAGDVEGERAAGALSPEQARRAWEALPAVGAALAEHGPDLVDIFVPAAALLQRLEGFRAPPAGAHPAVPQAPRSGQSEAGQAWQVRLRELARRAQESAPPAPGPGRGQVPQADLCAQVTRVLHSVSLRKPLLLAIDDLQWADAGTAALLFHLGRHLAGSRILLACSYRPEAIQAAELDRPDLRDPPGLRVFGGHVGLASVLQELAREWGDVCVDLDRADGRAFVEAYVDSEPNRLGRAFRQALYDHTEGNPLFTVELLRSLERQGALVREEAGPWIEAPGLDWGQVPARVEAVIAGHLAGLPEEDRALLGAASTQGDTFAAEVAARVAGWDEETAARRLSGPLRSRHRLVEAVRLDRLASNGQRLSNYRFRHWLVQRCAYEGLDSVERARLHEATGRALDAIYAQGERPAGLAVELARHYEAAGMALEAARALHDAGREAMRLSAFRQALDMFDHGLALLAVEPPSPKRTELQRLLEVARLAPQRNLDGMSGTQFEDALARSKEAWAGDAQGGPLFQMLAAEAEDLSARGQNETALALATRLHDEAARQGEEGWLAVARWRMGAIHTVLGNLHEGERHFEWLLAWLTPENWAILRSLAGHDLTAACLAFSAVNQWFLGHPETALARATEAMAGAVARGELYGQAFAFGIGAAALFLLRADEAAMGERVDCLRHLALKEGFAAWQMYSDVFVGRLVTLRQDGDPLGGVRRMQAAIAAWRAAGLVPDTDILTTVLADTCLAAARRLGSGDAGLHEEILAAGMAAVETMLGPESERCGPQWAAELYRLRGELLLERDGLAAAGKGLACFQTSMGLARDHALPSVELRAAMSLVRLRERQGDACEAELPEARQWLAAVYGRFTEGLGLPDLQDAAALIGQSS